MSDPKTDAAGVTGEQSTSTTNAQSGQSAPSYLTKEDAQIMFNNALSSHLKRIKPVEPDAIANVVKEQLASFLAGPKPEPTELEQLKHQQAELAKALQAEREGRKHDKREALKGRAVSELATALAGKVRPEAVPVVVDLMQARGALKVSDEGYSMHLNGMDLSVADGVSEFLKTSEAALFVPAPTNNQTTFQRAPTVAPSGPKLTKAEAKQAAMLKIANSFKGL